MVDGVWRDNISCKQCGCRHPVDLSCDKARKIAEANRPETVPCKWCDTPTRMTGTKMCDGCRELDGRIRRDSHLAERILKHYREQQ